MHSIRLAQRTMIVSAVLTAIMASSILNCIAQIVPKALFTQLGNSITCSTSTEDLGKALSVSGDGKRVAVGVPGFKVKDAVVGSVRLFEFDGNTWKQLGEDLLGDLGVGSVGEAIALSSRGDVLIIGSYTHSHDRGRASVYKLVNGKWTLVGSPLDGKAEGDRFAYSVSINAEGTRIAIGASGVSAHGAKSGEVSVYELKAGQWKLLGVEIPGKKYWTFSGSAVDLNAKGDVVAIGAPENDDYGNNAGIIEVFRFNGTSWVKRGDDISGAAPENQCGYDFALNAAGDVLVVGVKHYGKNSEGHVRVLRYHSGKWQQVGAEIKGESSMDNFGSVAINASGTRIAGGAWWSYSGGRMSGSVRVFDLVEGNWVQHAKIPGRELQLSGCCVGMSDKGSIIAIGAPGPDPVGGGGPLGSLRILRE